METKTICGIVAVLLTLAASALTIASLALPLWYDLGISGNTVQIGLFRSCVEILGFSVCTSTPTGSDTFEATKWLALAGTILIGIALLFGLILLCTKSPCVAITACVFDVVGGLCMLAAVAIFARDSHAQNLTGYYGAGFIVAIVGLSLAIIAGVLFAFAKPEKSGHQGHVINPY